MRTDAAPRRALGRPFQRQRGQALVETLVASIALLTLLAGIVAVGRLLDVRHASIAAARSLAFECSVRPAECARTGTALAQETRSRHFARDDREVLSDDSAFAEPSPLLARKPGWTDRAGRPLLDRPDAVSAATPGRHLDAPSARIGPGSGIALPRGVSGLLLDVAGPARFGLTLAGGLHAAEVQARVGTADLRSRFGLADRPDRATVVPRTLEFSARTAILVDAWAASGPGGGRDDSVHARVGIGARLPGPVPAEAGFDAGYAGVRALMRGADALALEPTAGRFESRGLRVDVVPADRRPR